jgi:hypothetical protein
MSLLTELRRPDIPPSGPYKSLADLCLEAAGEIERLRAALEEISSHDTGMKADFSVGAKQAAIARAALAKTPS